MTDDVECPMTVNPCRFCSIEKTYRPYMRIEKDARTGLFHPLGLGKTEVILGHMCNNLCCWTSELESCPVPDNLIIQQEMIEEYNKIKEKAKLLEEKRKRRKKTTNPVKKVIKKVVKPTTTKKKLIVKDVKKRKV